MNKFSQGDRVVMTEQGLKQGLGDRSKTGVVKGYAKSGNVIVHRDGLKRADSWHPDFWRALPSKRKRIKPCPFCATHSVRVAGIITFSALCQNPRCYAIGPSRKTAANAVKAWNTRKEQK